MITIAIDAHKRLHVAAALEDAGRPVGEWTGAKTPEDWQQCLDWLRSLGNARAVGIEGAGALGRGLAQHLVAAGEQVFEITHGGPPSPGGRRGTMDKSDLLDAHSVTDVVRQHSGELPRVHPDGDSTLLNLLTTEREDLMTAFVRLQHQLHALS